MTLEPLNPLPPANEPSLADLATNFTLAVAGWARAGFPVVTACDYATRSAICAACPDWTGRTCRRCGCARLKLWLATERCPAGKWAANPLQG